MLSLSAGAGRPLALLFLICYTIFQCVQVSSHLTSEPMSEEERLELKDDAKEMFYHAYNAYMANAYPADELLPLSCAGRYRDLHTSRGDIDDVLGNFSLTLVDTLDTLVLLGDLPEFEKAVKLIIRDVSFDTDVIVSVFETNIRMVGGLISGHVLADHLHQLYGIMSWYRGELLQMALDLATRLLPAFNTTTGIPYPRINLRDGMKSPLLHNSRDTCTSCAGTMILEFASLSRLTGHPVFEETARRTMDYLWQQRHRATDLVGTVLNVHSGDWVRRDSGVGAGIDSYYEYLLKTYILFGDTDYLHRFNKHYSAVMKYVSQGPMLLDVHMHRPHTTTRNYMDAFLAFWPGLQVLKGDMKPAIETHEMLYQVIQRHNFLPEAFTTDFQVHWGQHPLRPEFVESTYLLYEATEDPYYLRVGREVLRALQQHAWVPCGYAAVKDVRTGGHEDRMDSFVLSETFKYLYLLFSKPNELPINLDDFLFTTEAHLLPLSLSRTTNLTPAPLQESDEPDSDLEFYRSCPNAHSLFPGKQQFAENIRRPLKNFVDSVCPNRNSRGGPLRRKLKAMDFQAGNTDHVELLRDMGITIVGLPDGRVQLLHTSGTAGSADDAQEGLLFMQEMVDMSKVQQEQPDNPPKAVVFGVREPANTSSADGKEDEDIITVRTLVAGPAQFGLQLKDDVMVKGQLVVASPYRACQGLSNSMDVGGKIVLMERGDCMFLDKARVIQSLGAIGGIVVDNPATPSPPADDAADSPPMFAMSGDQTAGDVTIPMVFLFAAQARELLQAHQDDGQLVVLLSDMVAKDGAPAQVVLAPGEESQGACAPTAAATLQAVLAAKAKEHGLKGEGSDDLVTLVEGGSKEGGATKSPGPPLSRDGDTLPGEAAIVTAVTVEELLTEFKEYLAFRRRQAVVPSGEDLLQRVQLLLTRKGRRNPQLLRALLSSHLSELVKLLEDSVNISAEDVTEVDANASPGDDDDSSSSEVAGAGVVSDATPEGATVGSTEDGKDATVSSTNTADLKLTVQPLVDEVVNALVQVLVIYSARQDVQTEPDREEEVKYQHIVTIPESNLEDKTVISLQRKISDISKMFAEGINTIDSLEDLSSILTDMIDATTTAIPIVRTDPPSSSSPPSEIPTTTNTASVEVPVECTTNTASVEVPVERTTTTASVEVPVEHTTNRASEDTSKEEL